MQVFLIRHPPPRLAAGLCYGQLDVDADDALPIVERLRPLLPHATPIVASPLRRTRQLAEALHRRPQFDRRLMEIDFGEWEGRAWEHIDRAALDAWAADLRHFAPPGGESAAMLQARVVDCLAGLRFKRVALVTHAGPIRAALGHWLRLPVEEWSRLTIDFGSLTLIEVEAGTGAALRYLNR
ncbi:histidine phosphatase family protein [Accumulibacter sp.]|uniref:histidine phosphatase family protein n=1 Tax=Accumulibacter sp. TaxID=2053492 RepID=UPI002606CDA5|nr:histidine phosphatase family protein [Accumulibacter sp.]